MVAPTFREALRFWLKLGCISFGGPTGQIAILHTELVERRRWIGEREFLQALNFCMLLPGPEATQLATYCGWRLHGVRGGIAAGALFVLPSAVLLWALAWLYVTQGSVPWMVAVFHGLKPAVTAIVVSAVIRIGRRTLHTVAHAAVAAAAFGAIFFGHVPFPVIVAAAALVGFFGLQGRAERTSPAEVADVHGSPAAEPAGWAWAAKVVAVSLLVWWAPVLGAGLWQGWDGVLVREALFFSQAALVTFGGAYAVLPYVAQHAVEHQHWLTAAQMVDGLGLAETTPGPLIMVVQFVGFLGGWNQPGAQPPLLMATLGAALTTWTTFVPSFLWIFLGGPHLARLGRNPRLTGALGAVTAAVVGVVLNLAVWFGLRVFRPDAGGMDGFALVIGSLAFVALQWFRVGVVAVVLASGLVGLAWSFR